MKQIATQNEKERKEKRNKTILGIILLLLMVLSTAGYAFYHSAGDSSRKVKYQGTTFTLLEDGLWHFKVNDIEYATSYTPQETENISNQNFISLNQYSGKELYFNYDSNQEAVYEINMNLGRFASRVQEACYGSCEVNLPELNCSENMIIIQENNLSSVTKEDNCIFITADAENLIKASDSFIFKIAGII